MYAVPPRGFSGPVKSRKGTEERKENAEEKKRERRRRGKQTGEGSPLSCAAGTLSSPVANSLLSTGSSPPFPFAATHIHTRAHIHIHIHIHIYTYIKRYGGNTQSGAVRRVTKREMGTTDTEAAAGEGSIIKEKSRKIHNTMEKEGNGEKRRVQARENLGDRERERERNSG